MGSIIIDDKKAIAALTNTERQAKKSSATFKQMGQDVANAGKAIAVGLTVAATAATALVVKFSDVTSEIADNSKKVNMSAKEYQKWTYAAKQSGMEQETLLGLMKKQQTAYTKASSGNKKLAESYKKLGVNINEWTSEEAFEQVILKLSMLKDETLRNSLANEIFGKSYSDLMPLLSEGAKDIMALRDRAEELGIVISDEAVAAGDKFGDTMDDLKAIFTGIGYELAVELLPYFQDFADWVIANKDGIKAFATETIQKLGDALKSVADWVLDIVNDKDKAKEALDNIKSFVLFLTGASIVSGLATHPLITIVGAIATLMTFKDQFADLYNNMTPTQKTITMLGALALAVGSVLVAATGGAAGVTIGVGMAALALAVGSVVALADSKTKQTNWVPPTTKQVTDNAWQYGSGSIDPSAYYSNAKNTSDDISKAVTNGLKNVKIVLDDKQVGSFVQKTVLTGLDK